eukprot:CAMPEP_0184307928 /NCGR_PEP_ID=MMETSP1049-20130417/16529_1 /TAXON_ID=77928 /ORGANISM="Proteomonas sulcata, Strain CCMP704" /LENGTH=371 /DNA_ID=CAMNT_0026620517 /DNA_START=72 /DNA_END=1187 /DNA_ORIENTATION=-
MSWALFRDMLADSYIGIYIMFLAIISLLGVLMSPIFFVFLMLDFFRSRDGRLVLQAVIHGAPNLFRSFILGIIVIVCFGFYSYAYFSQTVNVNQELCHSPFQCVAKHVLDSMTGDLTSVLGDDFGNFAYPAFVPWKDSWYAWRSTFVFASIIFWVFLLQGIIQGQIIDAFAEKRNQDNELRQDLEQKCFVSSIDRFVFNNYPGEWEKRQGGRYAWNYLFFFYNLMEKEEDERSGLETEVAQAFENGEISFLPVEIFWAKQRVEMSEQADATQSVLTTVSDKVTNLESDLGQLKEVAEKLLVAITSANTTHTPQLRRDTSTVAAAGPRLGAIARDAGGPSPMRSPMRQPGVAERSVTTSSQDDDKVSEASPK